MHGTKLEVEGYRSGVLFAGVGVTTALLKRHDVVVFSQHQIGDAIKLLDNPDYLSEKSIY